MLTLQATSSEAGSVPRTAGSDVTTGNAANTSTTRTVAEMTANQINAGNLGVVFNINEPGSSADVTIQTFTMRFYYNSESSFFDITWDGPLTLTPFNQGTGGAGYLFLIALTSSQAADFFADPSNRVGMLVPTGSPITDSGDGPENFSLVPSPGASALLGLCVIAANRRRR